MSPLELNQATLFCAEFLGHLREVFLRAGGGTPSLRVLDHLTQHGLNEWRLSVGSLEWRDPKTAVSVSFFQCDDAAWGEPGVISARRWKKDVQYQAVRRLLSKRLGVDLKTLRRRFDEAAMWGPTFEQYNAVRRLLAASRTDISRESLLERLAELELELRGSGIMKKAAD